MSHLGQTIDQFVIIRIHRASLGMDLFRCRGPDPEMNVIRNLPGSRQYTGGLSLGKIPLSTILA